MTRTFVIDIMDADCIGDGLCCEHAAATFRISKAGKSTVIDPDGDAFEQVLAAATDCRMKCICLRDAATGEPIPLEELTKEQLAAIEEIRAVTLDRDEWAEWRDHGGEG